MGDGIEAVLAMDIILSSEPVSKSPAEQENEHYQYARQNLNKIKAQGIQEFEFDVDSNVSGLPEYGGLARLTGYKSQYKKPNETNQDYLKRVFETFQFYPRKKSIRAYCRGLSLNFDISDEVLEKNRGRYHIFKPYYTNLPEIIEEMDYVKYRRHVRFSHFNEGRLKFNPFSDRFFENISMDGEPLKGIQYRRIKRITDSEKRKGRLIAAAVIISMLAFAAIHYHCKKDTAAETNVPNK